MRIFCLVLFGLFCFENAFAQIDNRDIKSHVILKYLPLGLFDIDNTIQFGIEVPFPDDRFTVQQEFGFGHTSFNLWYHDQQDRPDKQTFKTRTQFRFYFSEKRWVRSYVAAEYLMKRVEHKETQWVGQDCLTGNCGYFENKTIKFGRFADAGHIKLGWQFYFNNRMTLDLYTGFGIRKMSFKTLTPEAGNARPHDDYVWWDGTWANTHQVVPSLAVGFQFGFALGKFQRLAK
jgi:hypothetical protein